MTEEPRRRRASCSSSCPLDLALAKRMPLAVWRRCGWGQGGGGQCGVVAWTQHHDGEHMCESRRHFWRLGCGHGRERIRMSQGGSTNIQQCSDGFGPNMQATWAKFSRRGGEFLRVFLTHGYTGMVIYTHARTQWVKNFAQYTRGQKSLSIPAFLAGKSHQILRFRVPIAILPPSIGGS